MKFPNIQTPKYTTFFYGVCSDDAFTAMVREAEDMGCEFVQALAGMMMPPGSNLAIPGAKVQPIQVLRIVVRCFESEHAGILAKMAAKK